MLKRRKLFLVICFAALCLNATLVMADLSIVFDIDGTKMTMTNDGSGSIHTGDITIDTAALFPEPMLIADIVDSETGATLDRVVTYGGELTEDMLSMHLDFSGAGENWSAIGDLLIRDYSGADKIEAAFVSNSVEISGGNLDIAGALMPLSETSILVPSSDPWTFTGQMGGIPGGGADGEPYTITVPSNVGARTSGTIVVMHYALPSGIGSLQDLFNLSTGTELVRGDVDITITPIPTAVLLGTIGLGMAVVGLKLRKYA